MIERIIADASDLIGRLNSYPNHYIFRGHANADWTLQSSLERVIGVPLTDESARRFEDFSLSAFRSKFHLYDVENLQPVSKLAWLAIMQHYGVPTRLLDFTESPYVALYFALESYTPLSQHDLSVFAIDYTALMDASIEYIRERDSQFNESRTSLHEQQDLVFESVLDRFAYNIAWVAEPGLVNVRLDRQAGSFLISGNRGVPIEEILCSPAYSGVSIEKLRVPARYYEACFTLLRKMNITSKSLYGDLDGLARWVRMQMQVYASPSPENEAEAPSQQNARTALRAAANAERYDLKKGE